MELVYKLLLISSWIYALTLGSALPPFTSLQFADIPRDTVVVAGQSAVLNCSARYGGSALPAYSWARNGNVLTTRDRGVNRVIYSNGSLLVSNVNEGGPSPDTGSYRCIAEITTESSQYSRIATPEAKLQTAKLGDFLAQSSSSRVVAGDDIMFECLVDSLPAARVSWIKDGVRIQATERIFIHGNGEVIEIHTVSSRDTGLYMCIASNIAGSKNGTAFSVSLIPAGGEGNVPVFSVRPRDQTPVLGTTLTFYCSTYGRGNDGIKPSLTWLRQGSTIDMSSRSSGRYEIIGSGSLRIHNISEQDNGLYTCRGENSIDTLDAEASLTVLVAPFFVSQPTNTYSHVNNDVELRCDIRGTPEPKISWYKDSDLIVRSAYFNIVSGALRIMGLMKSDSGYFQCVGENSVGKVFATAQLIVLDEDPPEDVPISPKFVSALNSSALPSTPTGLKAIIISHTYVTLTWNGPQMFDSSIIGYTVSTISLSQLGGSRIRSANTSSTDYTVQGLQPNTEYLFQVASYNRNGRSLSQQELRIRTPAEAAVPGTVGNVQASATSHQSIRVAWTRPAENNANITEYRVLYYSKDQSLERNKSYTGLTASLEGLHPYTKYNIRVVAINSNGPGNPSEEVEVRTFSTRPSSPPLNISLEVLGTTAILLRWLPPPSDTVNGQITGYKIRYKSKQSFARPDGSTTDADARSYEITDLESDTEYLVRIAAVNINGTGEYSVWKEARTSGTEQEESRPPGQPLYMRADAFAREMIVSWTAPADNILVRGFKLGYGTITPDEQWKTLSPAERITTLHDLRPQSNYVLQLIAYNRAGESPPVMQQTFTSELLPDDDDDGVLLLPPLAVAADVISSTAVIVRWYDNTLGPSQIVTDGRYYTVRYNALSGSVQRRTYYLNTTDLFATIDELKPFTKYEFAVMVSKGRRTSLYSLTARNTTMEDVPDSAPEDLTVTKSKLDERFLSLSWQPPARPNGRLISYRIFSNTESTQPIGQWTAENVAAHNLNYEFGPVTTDKVYFFRINVVNSKGASPLSEIVSFRTSFVIGSRNSDIGPESSDKNAAVVEPAAADVSGSSILNSPYAVYIIIACVCVLVITAIVILTVILCRRRQRSSKQREHNSSVNNSINKNSKPKPPDLWIDHEQVGLNGMHKSDSEEPDEITSMIQSNFDISVSMAGDVPCRDDSRLSSVGRSRPIIIASQPHREGMPRAAVPPMNSDTSRPLYPRTQFAGASAYGSTPRVHVGDTSQPSAEYFQHHPTSSLQHPNTGGVPPSPAHESRVDALRSFSIPAPPSTHVPKHHVKPQPSSSFNPMAGSTYSPSHRASTPDSSLIGPSSPVHTGSLRRPTRHGADSSIFNNMQTASREELKNNMMTQSTEQLSAEMAHLDCIMQDLNAIKNDFEMS